MVEDVEQRRGHRQRRRRLHAVGAEAERETQADEDDADVLDRVIGEQPLEVVLHQRVEHAEHGGHPAEHDHDRRPPPGQRPHQVEGDADEGIDRDLGHHAAHQRRDVAGRRRVGQRQPDMQRHDAGLGTGADERQHQNQSAGERRQRRRAHGGEGVAAGGAGEQAEGEQQCQRAGAGHDDIDEAGLAILGVLVMGHDQRPRGQRHELPREQEGEGVVGEDHQVHGGEEDGIERQHTLGRMFMTTVAQRKEAGAGTAEIDHHQKEGRERVDAEMGADPRQAQRQHDRVGGGERRQPP